MRGKTLGASRPAQEQKTRGGADWRALLHPANAYSHPSNIVRDSDLALNEKRAILASWASDAAAVVSNPALRYGRSSDRPVGFDEIREALRSLDALAFPESDPKASGADSPWRWSLGPGREQNWRGGAVR